jgi:hypothetical protein
MRDTNDHNFDFLLVEDATVASKEELHKAAVEIVKTEGSVFRAISSTEKILVVIVGMTEAVNSYAKLSKLVVISAKAPFVFP